MLASDAMVGADDCPRLASPVALDGLVGNEVTLLWVESARCHGFAPLWCLARSRTRATMP